MVGNKECTGDALKATVKTTIARFKKTSFLIVDEEYWHNLKELSHNETDIAPLISEALAIESDYLRKNLPYILSALRESVLPEELLLLLQSEICFSDHYIQLASADELCSLLLAINELARAHDIGIEFTRTTDLYTPEQQKQLLNQFQMIRAQNPEVETALQESIRLFVDRHFKNDEENPLSATEKHQRDTEMQLLRFRSEGYLTEENAKVFDYAKRIEADFVGYNGKFAPIFEATRKHLFPNGNGIQLMQIFSKKKKSKSNAVKAQNDLDIESGISANSSSKTNYSNHQANKHTPLSSGHTSHSQSPTSLPFFNREVVGKDVNKDKIFRQTTPSPRTVQEQINGMQPSLDECERYLKFVFVYSAAVIQYMQEEMEKKKGQEDTQQDENNNQFTL